MADQPRPGVTLCINDKTTTVPKGTTVYHAAKDAGIEIPIFCYHDRMPPLGACRMCLVQVEKFPKLQTACTFEATDGMVVHTTTPEVRAAQEGILELLLINHPLDCPICDKGGECPLQDQTYAFGPARSRFTERKRDFAKPVSLGPVLVLDRERCILCWRCVRFGEVIAGDDALKGFERGFHSEINTPFTLPVQSKFIGNTIGICPVGALTARSYRFVARPWDNQTVPSVCMHCGVGCAVDFDVRGGAITRTRPREQPAINDVWLCDLGYYGHAYVGHGDRLRKPLVRGEGGLIETTWDDALDLIARRLQVGPRVGMLGGARLTNEDAYVAARFFRSVVGTPHLDHRVDAPAGSPSLTLPWGMANAIAELAEADAILLAGCDITEEYPVLWLRIKQAVDRGAKLIVVTPKALEVGRFIAHHLVHRYGEASAVLAALLRALRGDSLQGGDCGGGATEAITVGAAVLAAATRPLVMVGKLALDAPDGWASARAIEGIGRLRNVPVNVMRGKGNAFGAALAGLLPDAGPGGQPLAAIQDRLEATWGAPLDTTSGLTAPAIVDAAAQGTIDVLYVIGADPSTDLRDRARWAEARARLSFVVVQDAFLTGTARDADVVLPVLVGAEKDGTVSNLEGRIQRVQAAVHGPGEARGDWQVLSALAQRLGKSLAYSGWEEIFAEMAGLIPGLRIDARVPPASPARAVPTLETLNPPQPSGGESTEYPLVAFAGDVLFDRGAMTSRCPTIADLAGVPWVLVHPADASRADIREGDVVAVTSQRSTVVLRAQLSTAILPGSVYLPRGFEEVPLAALFEGAGQRTQVRLAVLTTAGASKGPEAGGKR